MTGTRKFCDQHHECVFGAAISAEETNLPIETLNLRYGSRKLPARVQPVNDRLQYIRDLPRCMRNGKLRSGSGRLVAANISDRCTSGVTPKSDVQNYSLNFRNVLYSDLYRVKAVRQLPTRLRPSQHESPLYSLDSICKLFVRKARLSSGLLT